MTWPIVSSNPMSIRAHPEEVKSSGQDIRAVKEVSPDVYNQITKSQPVSNQNTGQVKLPGGQINARGVSFVDAVANRIQARLNGGAAGMGGVQNSGSAFAPRPINGFDPFSVNSLNQIDATMPKIYYDLHTETQKPGAGPQGLAVDSGTDPVGNEQTQRFRNAYVNWITGTRQDWEEKQRVDEAARNRPISEQPIASEDKTKMLTDWQRKSLGNLYEDTVAGPAGNIAVTPGVPVPIRAAAGILYAPKLIQDVVKTYSANATGKNGEYDPVTGAIETGKQLLIDPIANPVKRLINDPLQFASDLYHDPTKMWQDVFLPVAVLRGAAEPGIKMGESVLDKKIGSSMDIQPVRAVDAAGKADIPKGTSGKVVAEQLNSAKDTIPLDQDWNDAIQRQDPDAMNKVADGYEAQGDSEVAAGIRNYVGKIRSGAAAIPALKERAIGASAIVSPELLERAPIPAEDMRLKVGAAEQGNRVGTENGNTEDMEKAGYKSVPGLFDDALSTGNEIRDDGKGGFFLRNRGVPEGRMMRGGLDDIPSDAMPPVQTCVKAALAEAANIERPSKWDHVSIQAAIRPFVDKPQAAMPYLVDIGKQVLREGYNRGYKWSVRMREYLGDTWKHFGRYMTRVWSYIHNERGQLGRGDAGSRALVKQGQRPAEVGSVSRAGLVSEGSSNAAEDFVGILKGEKVQLPGVKTEVINYTKRNPADTTELRNIFDNTERKKFLETLSADTDGLKRAGFTEVDIARIQDGLVPKGWQVHHVMPLDGGGTNAMDNLVLIRNDPFHKVINSFQITSTKGMLPGDSMDIEWPIITGKIYPPEF